MHRHVAALTEVEWRALCDDFADLVLTKHGVVGSIGGLYSLYDALDREREKAIHELRKRLRAMPGYGEMRPYDWPEE